MYNNFLINNKYMKKKKISNRTKKMELIENIHLIIKKNRKVYFKDDEDLYKSGAVDSFDIINIISEIEKKYSVKLNFTNDKKFVFSVKNLNKKILEQKK